MPDNQESPSKDLDAHKGGDLGDKLLPCPFCNAPAKFTDGKYSNGHQYADGKVQCVECDAELYATNAIQVWNTRASSKQLTATQQALDSAVEALEWKPIETAPMDKIYPHYQAVDCLLLGHNPAWNYPIPIQFWIEHSLPVGDKNERWASIYNCNDLPTHWRPLPPSPKAALASIKVR